MDDEETEAQEGARLVDRLSFYACETDAKAGRRGPRFCLLIGAGRCYSLAAASLYKAAPLLLTLSSPQSARMSTSETAYTTRAAHLHQSSTQPGTHSISRPPTYRIPIRDRVPRAPVASRVCVM